MQVASEAPPAPEEEETSGPGEVSVLLRALVWDEPGAAKGSGYTRVHRAMNRATLTLPPGALTFGFVDKVGATLGPLAILFFSRPWCSTRALVLTLGLGFQLEPFSGADWRQLTGAEPAEPAEPAFAPSDTEPARGWTPGEQGGALGTWGCCVAQRCRAATTAATTLTTKWSWGVTVSGSKVQAQRPALG